MTHGKRMRRKFNAFVHESQKSKLAGIKFQVFPCRISGYLNCIFGYRFYLGDFIAILEGRSFIKKNAVNCRYYANQVDKIKPTFGFSY
ncbi:MAG: hypothetical protein AAGU27_02605 [Dehalobacterium sp.]